MPKLTKTRPHKVKETVLDAYEGDLTNIHVRGQIVNRLRSYATEIARGNFPGARLRLEFFTPGVEGSTNRTDERLIAQIRSEGGELLVRACVRLLARADDLGVLSTFGKELLAELASALKIDSVADAKRVERAWMRMNPGSVCPGYRDAAEED